MFILRRNCKKRFGFRLLNFVQHPRQTVSLAPLSQTYANANLPLALTNAHFPNEEYSLDGVSRKGNFDPAAAEVVVM